MGWSPVPVRGSCNEVPEVLPLPMSLASLYGRSTMSDESVSATTAIGASAGAVFAVLAHPARHAAIDGTGWVCEAVDPRPITASGQVFRMGMFHPDHPNGNYEIHNVIIEFVHDRVIAWRPGFVSDETTGALGFGGWTWRYDLRSLGPEACEVTHTYDWSAVGPDPREHLDFPPFPPDHLANSLHHLAEMATDAADSAAAP